MRSNARLFGQLTLFYALSYLVSGGLAYQLVTKQFYVGDDPIFARYLRSEANPAEWAHVNRWMVPGLLLRSALVAAVLLPLAEALARHSFGRRVAYVFAMLFVLTHLAAAAPSPSNIEGFIYLKPELMGVMAFLLTQPEMVLQCLLFSLGAAGCLPGPARRMAEHP